MKTIEDVKRFWEKNPLWSGETVHSIGTIEYFKEHNETVIKDCFAGKIDKRIFPVACNRDRVLDLGCGPGFWTIELKKSGADFVLAADITNQALELTKKRCELFGIDAQFSLQNAEKMTFENEAFTHVNCQGVIHHTPDTLSCVREISRVLRKDGTALISVYFQNVILKGWPFFSSFGGIFKKCGAGMKGRGRENIFGESNIDEIVRTYDGIENPIGKAYTKKQVKEMVEPYFVIEDIFLHFFPARSLPFKIPRVVHILLDRFFGFMIFFKLRKK